MTGDPIICAACAQAISTAEYPAAWVWTDPAGVVCAAHDHCLAPYSDAAAAVDASGAAS